jgi:hypothetical protein
MAEKDSDVDFAERVLVDQPRQAKSLMLAPPSGIIQSTAVSASVAHHRATLPAAGFRARQ